MSKVKYQRTVDDLNNWNKKKKDKVKEKQKKKEKEFVQVDKKKWKEGDVHIRGRFVQLNEKQGEKSISPVPEEDRAETVTDRLYSYQNIYAHKRFQTEMDVYGKGAHSTMNFGRKDKRNKNKNHNLTTNLGRGNFKTGISTINKAKAQEIIGGFNGIPVRETQYGTSNTNRLNTRISNMNNSLEMNKEYSYLASKSQKISNRSRTPTNRRLKEMQRPIDSYIKTIQKDLSVN